MKTLIQGLLGTASGFFWLLLDHADTLFKVAGSAAGAAVACLTLYRMLRNRPQEKE